MSLWCNGLRRCIVWLADCEFFQLLLEGDRGVVGSEHFRRQPFHLLLEVLVEHCRLWARREREREREREEREREIERERERERERECVCCVGREGWSRWPAKHAICICDDVAKILSLWKSKHVHVQFVVWWVACSIKQRNPHRSTEFSNSANRRKFLQMSNLPWVCRRDRPTAACLSQTVSGSWTPASPPGLCCSIEWSPSRGNRTPRQTLCRPTLHGVLWVVEKVEYTIV